MSSLGKSRTRSVELCFLLHLSILVLLISDFNQFTSFIFTQSKVDLLSEY